MAQTLQQQPTRYPACFSDIKRSYRSLLIGTAVSITALVILNLTEALSLGFLVAMVFDMVTLFSVSYALSPHETRAIFSRHKARPATLVKRTILLAFMSFGLMSICVKDIHNNHDSHLPVWVRLMMYFSALFLTWMQLQNGFAAYYAKKYFMLNPNPACNGNNPQGFVFPSTDEPVFTDFLYVSYAVGLTYAMSDTNLEDSSIRRAVLVHSIISFLFYSTVITAVLNLVTTT
jgi:uncharacterized membrane protein